MDKLPLSMPKGMADTWGAMGAFGLGALALPYIWSTLVGDLKGKTMTALENAMLNFIVPLIDTLRAVEKERDTERDRARKYLDQYREMESTNKDLESDVARLRAEAQDAASRAADARLKIDELTTLVKKRKKGKA